MDVSAGPFWHSPEQFVICRRSARDGCTDYSPALMNAGAGQFFSNVAGPLGSVASKVVVPVTPAP